MDQTVLLLPYVWYILMVILISQFGRFVLNRQIKITANTIFKMALWKYFTHVNMKEDTLPTPKEIEKAGEAMTQVISELNPSPWESIILGQYAAQNGPTLAHECIACSHTSPLAR